MQDLEKNKVCCSEKNKVYGKFTTRAYTCVFIMEEQPAGYSLVLKGQLTNFKTISHIVVLLLIS
jgi:hypothetical protein